MKKEKQKRIRSGEMCCQWIGQEEGEENRRKENERQGVWERTNKSIHACSFVHPSAVVDNSLHHHHPGEELVVGGKGGSGGERGEERGVKVTTL